jgi:hypothetical protein
MAKLTALPEAAIINGFKGTIDFYVHDGIACARRWPRSPSAPRAPAVQATWQVFKDGISLWPKLSPAVQAAYVEMSVGTTLTGRDYFMKDYMIGAIEIVP